MANWPAEVIRPGPMPRTNGEPATNDSTPPCPGRARKKAPCPSPPQAAPLPRMTFTITDDIYDQAERLLRLPAGQADSHLRDAQKVLRKRMIEPEFVSEQHARALALIARIDAALGGAGEQHQRRLERIMRSPGTRHSATRATARTATARRPSRPGRLQPQTDQVGRGRHRYRRGCLRCSGRSSSRSQRPQVVGG